MTDAPIVALIGFGEVGQTLARDLVQAGVTELRAWDVRFADRASIPSLALPNHPIVRAAASATEAVRGATLVISAVTAAQDVEAAEAAAPGMNGGGLFVDLNSASPGMKIRSAALIEAAGGRYVEAAVMSPIGPKRIASPMLLGGVHMQAFLDLAMPLGFTGAKAFSQDLGKASAAKMCRSVMVKGIEALLTESLLSARRYDVLDTVVGSLTDLFPLPNWPELSRYMISRSVEHGTRRAEEMREAARTVAEAGITPLMSTAIAERQDWAADFKPALEQDQLIAMLDAILQETKP
jgi:3-hydroxyisobutyrate dehydrogenase-like beta-hydroxyacid dehydrogenase